MNNNKHRPLSGVRIIELEAIGPVPLAGMILADMGADILRIERPGPSLADSASNAVLLRGRRRIAIDLKSDAGRSQLLELVRSADALIEGFRPGVMERLGLGPDICMRVNPALVFGRMTGWGQDGPLAHTAGHDIDYIAITGALGAIGAEGAAPPVPLNLIGDYGGGSLFLALGVVSALLAAKASGRGDVVDAAIVDGVAVLMTMFHALSHKGDWSNVRQGNRLDGGTPFYRCYECSDGKYIAVGALEPQFFALLLEKLDLEPGRFVQHDRSGWPAMEAAFTQRFATRARDEWDAHFQGTDCCVAPVLAIGEAGAHAHNAARGILKEVGGYMQPTPAPRFSSSPSHIPEASRFETAAEALAAWR